MKHIILLFYSFIIVLGVWAAFTIRQTHKVHRHPFLQSLFHYTLFLNATILFYQIWEYIYINLMERDMANIPAVPQVFVILLGIFIEVGLTWTFIRTVLGVQERQMNRRFERLFYAWIGLVGINFIVGATLFIQAGQRQWILVTYSAVMVIALGLMVAILIEGLIRGLGGHPPYKKRVIHRFLVLYLVYNFGFIGSGFLPSPANLIVLTAFLMVANLIPVYWLKVHYETGFVVARSYKSAGTLNMFFQQYQISRRERDIVELILAGKSNKEIESDLFISFNTVKNHIYRLYQKLGVNSRGQLMHLIHQYGKTEE